VYHALRFNFLSHLGIVMSPSSSLDSTQIHSLLRHKPFAFFWLARVAAAIAVQMQAVALGWQAYALTDVHPTGLR
jgi:hypothetical protein